MKKLYSIWDSKAEEFAPPFVAKNDKMACRMYLMSIKNIPYSDDMKLYCLGWYEPDNHAKPIHDVFEEPVQVPIEVTE